MFKSIYFVYKGKNIGIRWSNSKKQLHKVWTQNLVFCLIDVPIKCSLSFGRKMLPFDGWYCTHQTNVHCFKICLVISIILLLTTSLVIKCGIWANILSNHPLFFNICATWAIIWYIHPPFDLIRDWLTNSNWQYNEKSWASRVLELFSSKTLTHRNILNYFENLNTKNQIIHHHKSIQLEMHLIVDELILVN